MKYTREDPPVVVRDPARPHDWLDATVKAKPGESVVASIITEAPFRADGLVAYPSTPGAAGDLLDELGRWLVTSLRIGYFEQMAGPDVVPVPLSAVVLAPGRRLELMTCPSGTCVALHLKNTGQVESELTIRFCGRYIEGGSVPAS